MFEIYVCIIFVNVFFLNILIYKDWVINILLYIYIQEHNLQILFINKKMFKSFSLPIYLMICVSHFILLSVLHLVIWNLNISANLNSE